MKNFAGKYAPDTPNGCWCRDYENAWRNYKYWHRAFCISMFFHGMISIPAIIAVAVSIIQQLT